VVGALLARGLLLEVKAADGAPLWRGTADSHWVKLVATKAALAALGVESDTSPQATPQPRHRPGESH
jgi:hypothetical protein